MQSNYMLQRLNLKNGVVTKSVKQPKAIAKISEKKKQEVKEQKPAKELQNQWYQDIEAREFKEGKCSCWNCGEEILATHARAAIAHILPKRDTMFPSVSTQPLNYMILGPVCGCHQEYDCTWEDASKMQVWKIAVERFVTFHHMIASTEYFRLPELLTKEL